MITKIIQTSHSQLITYQLDGRSLQKQRLRNRFITIAHFLDVDSSSSEQLKNALMPQTAVVRHPVNVGQRSTIQFSAGQPLSDPRLE